ncbi:hypothetical protein ANO14919_005610 [Xylariales sp. No.14919]|nr:hypothetical protein ANO14919_005610 [Xylariales sp. No.14919]
MHAASLLIRFGLSQAASGSANGWARVLNARAFDVGTDGGTGLGVNIAS